MFDVGEILYLLSNKNHKIVPAIVQAVTTVKKIGGTEISHEISVPGFKEKLVLEKLDVKSFKDIYDLRKHVLALLEEKLDEEIKGVVALAQNDRQAAQRELASDLPVTESRLERVQHSPQDTIQEIELEDGVKARVHLPKGLM